ncbi:MAG: aspartyl protease family protein [Ferruginibacter sp.]
MAIKFSFFVKLAFVSCLVCVYAAAAGKTKIDPPVRHLFFEKYKQRPGKDPFVTTDSANCIIPFSRAGNLIIIRAKADTVEGNFILDTGAPGLVLNITYFRNYTPVEHGDDIQGGLTGAVEGGGRIELDKLSFGPVKYEKVEADRINLGHIENNKGIKIHGLMGMQLFKNFEMIIDYENNLIHLHLLGKKDPKDYKHELLKDTTAYIESPVEFVENKLITFVYSGGKKLKFIIDTGAESNLIDSRLPDKILGDIVVTRRVFLTGTGSSRVEALSGNANKLSIGNYDVSNLPVIVTNLEKLCYAYEKCLDGMLGFDFLSRQKIGFNFVKRKMYIWK